MGTWRILSLDGGGIRGLIEAIWLKNLEQRLNNRTIADCFDLIAGTSTGSILACALARGIPLATIIDLYTKRGKEIFPSLLTRLWSTIPKMFTLGPDMPKYDGIGLERVVTDVFGDTEFGELHPVVLVMSYDVFNRQAVVFKNNVDEFKGLMVRDIVKASCSAPTFFPAHVMSIRSAKLPLADGGIVANNPTACAIAEGIKINNRVNGASLENFIVASFGTGETNRRISVRESQEWGLLEWAPALIEVLFDGSTEATDYIARQIIGQDHYFRFQTPLDRAYDDMDNADEVNIFALKGIAEGYMSLPETQHKMNLLAELL